MKYAIFLLLPFLLLSCGKPAQETPIQKGYSFGFMKTVESASPVITHTKEYTDCVEPTLKMCVKQTANEISRKNTTFEVCDALDQKEDRDSCKYGVVMTQISQNNVPTLCKTLMGKYKDECYIASINIEAGKKNDTTQCDTIFDVFETGSSINFEDRVDQCKLNIIMKKGNVQGGDCDVLLDKNKKRTCLSRVRKVIPENSK